MEKEFEHIRTPERNVHQPDMKLYLTNAWQKTDDADEFLKLIAQNGYTVAAGTQRAYMVIDETGRSFDLVRQLDGVRTKEVRERFKTTKLVKEKQAIASHRQSSQKSDGRSKLKAAVNDNATNVGKGTVKDQPISFSFTVQEQLDSQVSAVSEVIDKMDDDKAAKKRAMLDKLKRERLQKAKEFRENEREL